MISPTPGFGQELKLSEVPVSQQGAPALQATSVQREQGCPSPFLRPSPCREGSEMESSPRVTECFAIITSVHTHPRVTGREAEGQGSGSQDHMAGEGSGWLR